MLETLREITLGVSGEKFPEGTHMCLIYDDDETRKEVITKFIADGIFEREQVSYYGDVSTVEDIHEWLDSMDNPILGQERLEDQFAFHDTASIYYPNGQFQPEDMISTLRSTYASGIAGGYPGVRLTGEMTWALKGVPGSETQNVTIQRTSYKTTW